MLKLRRRAWSSLPHPLFPNKQGAGLPGRLWSEQAASRRVGSGPPRAPRSLRAGSFGLTSPARFALLSALIPCPERSFRGRAQPAQHLRDPSSVLPAEA